MKRTSSGKKKVNKPVQAPQRTPARQGRERTGGASAPSPEKRGVSSALPVKKGLNKPAQGGSALKKNIAKKPITKKQAHKSAANKPSALPKQEQGNGLSMMERSPMTAAAKKQTAAAMNKRTKKSAKRGSRGGNYSLYYILGAVVLVIVFIILANTVLFDCTSIVVEGNTAYTSEDIARISGISLGDNLLKTDLDAAEQSIVTTFPYIDMAEVKRTSPTKVLIKITEAEKWYCTRYGSRSYIISRRGKIVEQGVDDQLPVVLGYEADSPVVGAMLKSSIDGKTELPSVILTAAETAGITGITSLNITDRFGIELVVEDRITLQLGNSTELESKMNIGREFVENVIGATESVTIDLTNPEKVPVRDNNIAENPAVVPVLPESDTAEGTSESTAEASEEA